MPVWQHTKRMRCSAESKEWGGTGEHVRKLILFMPTHNNTGVKKVTNGAGKKPNSLDKRVEVVVLWSSSLLKPVRTPCYQHEFGILLLLHHLVGSQDYTRYM